MLRHGHCHFPRRVHLSGQDLRQRGSSLFSGDSQKDQAFDLRIFPSPRQIDQAVYIEDDRYVCKMGTYLFHQLFFSFCQVIVFREMPVALFPAGIPADDKHRGICFLRRLIDQCARHLILFKGRAVLPEDLVHDPAVDHLADLCPFKFILFHHRLCL